MSGKKRCRPSIETGNNNDIESNNIKTDNINPVLGNTDPLVLTDRELPYDLTLDKFDKFMRTLIKEKVESISNDIEKYLVTLAKSEIREDKLLHQTLINIGLNKNILCHITTDQIFPPQLIIKEGPGKDISTGIKIHVGFKYLMNIPLDSDLRRQDKKAIVDSKRAITYCSRGN